MDKIALEKELKLDRQLCFAVYSVAHAFTRVYKPLLEPLGLTYPQYLVMMALWERNMQPVKTLGEALGLDSGTLSPLLKRLEQAELVTRTRGTKDERQVLITLTEKGAALKDAATGVLQSIGEALGCDLNEASELRDALHALRRNLLAAAG